MYFNYHAVNLKRIKSGELVGIAESDKDEFAFVLIFSAYPYTRPIRHKSAYIYAFLFEDD